MIAVFRSGKKGFALCSLCLCGEIELYFPFGIKGLWQEFLRLTWVTVSNVMAA